MRYQQRFNPSDPVATIGGQVPYAEGGEVSHLGPYRIHIFTVDQANTYDVYKTRQNPGAGYNLSTTLNVREGGLMDILVVGGGGGGACMGGGGGAGGYILVQNYSVGAGSIPIQVGGGGGSEFAHNDNTQTPGGNSVFGAPGVAPSPTVQLTALGGGKGISYSYSFNASNPTPTAQGGSGGGGPGYGNGPFNGDGVGTPAAPGTPGQGHPGGRGHHGPQGHAGGGGGGAGEPGFPYNPANHSTRNNYTPNATGNMTVMYPPASPYAAFPTMQKGGNGLSNDMLGAITHFAGGGGGGGHPGHAINRSAGGLGGGGQGVSVAVNNYAPLSSDSYHLNGQPGQRNTGGGGGGSTHHSHVNQNSGKGGPGIVVVRYRTR